MLNNYKIIKITLFCVTIMLSLTLCSCKPIEDVHIFTDIKECQNIQSSKADDADVTIYDSPTKDKDLKDLEFQAFFGCKYKSDSLTFELFAYEFENSDVAMNYYANATGKRKDPNPTFTASTGIPTFSMAVVSENRAYSVSCLTGNKTALIAFLNSCFTENICEGHKTGDASLS